MALTKVKIKIIKYRFQIWCFACIYDNYFRTKLSLKVGDNSIPAPMYSSLGKPIILHECLAFMLSIQNSDFKKNKWSYIYIRWISQQCIKTGLGQIINIQTIEIHLKYFAQQSLGLRRG